MNAQPNLLARTPKQFPGESPLGFVLRVSEENGYETPWHVYRLAGIEQHEMVTSGLDINRIAKVLGRNTDELSGYTVQDAAGKSIPGVGGHPLAAAHLCLTNPRVCPECVKELGFVPVWSDLKLMDGCPTHRRMLVSSCPKCQKPLSWRRPGLLTCKCGHDLSNAISEPIGDSHVGLLAVIASKFAREPLPLHEDSCGLPTRELAAMSLRSLLRLLRALHKHAKNSRWDQVTSTAADVLSDWPKNFYKWLTPLEPKAVSHVEAIGLRKQFQSFYGALFRDGANCGETHFIRRAFLEFGSKVWGLSRLDVKLFDDYKLREQQRFRSLAETARSLRVQPATAHSILDRNPEAVKVVQFNGGNHYVVDMDALPIRPRAAGQSFSNREAARSLGIPVSVLNGLRVSGHVEQRHIGARLSSYHEADIEGFRSKVAALGIGPFMPVNDAISLADVMRMKLKSAEGKTQLVRDILDGKLVIVGTQGETLGDLLLDKHTILSAVETARTEAFDDALTPGQVAFRLTCDPGVVPTLIDRGLLVGRRVPAGLRVHARSVEAFSLMYRSLASLAKERGTSSRKLASEFEKRGIQLLRVERSSGKGAQPFVLSASKDFGSRPIEAEPH